MMIEETAPPADSLLAQFADAEGHYTDCFVAAGKRAELSDFVEAFYTQPLFQAERLVLRFAARAPSTDAEAAALARGDLDRFASWHVTARTDTELLLQDASGRTMSWLSTAGDLSFGSVVVPVRDRRGQLTLGPVFQSLLSVHKVYSRALLVGSVGRLRRAGSLVRPS